jgi:hypothetical protein
MDISGRAESENKLKEEKLPYKFTQVISKIMKKLHHNEEKFPTMPCNKLFHINITNHNDVEFIYLDVTYWSKSDEYDMRLCTKLCCALGECDENEKHSFVHSHCIGLEKCYSRIMKKMHSIFKCRKCREETSHDVLHELICDNCLIHEDSYRDEPSDIKKRKLFDCYVCGEEKINKKFKAELKCSGASKHSDELCQFCLQRNFNKCPQCG